MAKNKPRYEGQQYRGGRTKGRKNLKKLDGGGLLNQHGVIFTPEEKKALERAVNTANSKRTRMLKEEAKMPRMLNGRETGQSVGQLHLMGKESDFILARKSKSLQRFKTHDDYERYMKNLHRVNSKDYVTERIKLYKRNFNKTLTSVFGYDDTKDIQMKIRMMKPDDYMKMVQSDESLEIGYFFDSSSPANYGYLNKIRASLGMKLKEESIEY